MPPAAVEKSLELGERLLDGIEFASDGTLFEIGFGLYTIDVQTGVDKGSNFILKFERA